MTGGKSGKAMTELLIKTLRLDYNKVTKNIKEGTIVIITEGRIGLNYA
jgi:hypothetical protein